MIRETVHALIACVVTLVLCSGVYPLAVWGLGWMLFPHQAAGSLIERDGKVIGSELIAQPFASDIYFQPRPSAASYKADAASGSNLGTKNPDLRKAIAERAEAFKATNENPVPADLVTASGAGLDPDISPEAATYQAARVAAARKVAVEKVRSLIDRHIDRSAAIIGGPPRVNVLLLNLDLDKEIPAPASTAPAATTDAKPAGDAKPKDDPGAKPTEAAAAPAPASAPEAASPAPAAELTDARQRIVALSERIDKLGERLNAFKPATKPDDVKEIEARVAKLAEESGRVGPLVTQVSALDRRVKGVDDSLRSLRTEIAETRDALKALREKPAQPASAADAAAEIDLKPGLESFRKGQYAEAADAFRALTKSHPDDARAWYLAGVSRGLATNTWTGETEEMVGKGVERERAGTPEHAKIDAALADLTKTTGRDWLAYYRQRAASK